MSLGATTWLKSLSGGSGHRIGSRNEGPPFPCTPLIRVCGSLLCYGAMSESVRLTVLYEEGDDGWIIARIREYPAAMSQGRTREEARDNAIDALTELARSYAHDEANDDPAEAGEPVEVTVA